MSLLPKTPGGRLALTVVALALALNLLVVVLDALTPSPGGAPSSSFATEPRGFAAWAELARANGRDVRALRRAPSAAGGLPATGTVVVLDATELRLADARALRSFAEAGGHLVAGGIDGDRLARAVLPGGAPGWEANGAANARTLLPVAETRGVSAVKTAGEGTWTKPGGARSAVASADGPLLLVTDLGRGRVSLLADSSPLQNRLLGEADNASFALALSGDGPLTFAETVHGYGEATGIAAVPARWKWALALLAAAALLFMAARGRRMGAPEELRRALPPARSEYVEGLGEVLARAGDPTLGEPLRAAALARLRVGGDEGERLREAALSAGLSEEEATALASPVTTVAGGIAAGRALAHLERRAAGPGGRIAA